MKIPIITNPATRMTLHAATEVASASETASKK
jgi:hypothetical protein